eukprot:6185851-Pleurochrysis_carterae.AAC.4
MHIQRTCKNGSDSSAALRRKNVRSPESGCRRAAQMNKALEPPIHLPFWAPQRSLRQDRRHCLMYIELRAYDGAAFERGSL